MRARLIVTVVVATAALAACGDDGPNNATLSSSIASSPESTAVATAPTTVVGASTTIVTTSSVLPTTTPIPSTTSPGDITEPELRDELLQMFRDDQDERTGVSDLNGDRERADRLAAIVKRHGWPTHTMVGVDGGTAAWVIAQHADFDVEYQARMLALLTDAVDAGEADASEMAYLVDRVAVNRGRPQTYGTQIGGCTPTGAKAGKIKDAANVDRRRADVGLAPLADYLDEMCAAEGS